MVEREISIEQYEELKAKLLKYEGQSNADADCIFRNAERHPIAGKIIAELPLYLLDVDYSYQRCDDKNKLIKNWDDKKCSLLLTNYRPSEGKFYIIDGVHRYEAAKARGITHLACEIFNNLTREDEARIFALQDENIKPVSIFDKYSAGLIYGDPNSIAIRNSCKKYGFLVINKPGIKHLSALHEAYTFIKGKKDKEFALNWVFNIIQKSGWDGYPNSMNGNYFRAFAQVYNNTYDEELNNVSDNLINCLQNISPRVVVTYCNVCYDSVYGDRQRIGLLFSEIANKNIDSDDILSTFEDKGHVFTKPKHVGNKRCHSHAHSSMSDIVLDWIYCQPENRKFTMAVMLREINFTEKQFINLLYREPMIKDLFDKMDTKEQHGLYVILSKEEINREEKLS